jgi:hypothetical protein
MKPRFLFPLIFAVGLISLPSPYSISQTAHAAEATVSGPELAARLAGLRQGSTFIRMRMETGKSVLQIQMKERRSRGSTEVVYQVLFPKERKGESVLLTKVGNRAASGTHFIPPDRLRPIGAGEMTESLLGSQLSYEDIIEDFYLWDHQEIVGTDVIDRISCQILESKPGKSDRSSYTSVRTWVDSGRGVPLRIEKYRGGTNLARRIETTRIVTASSRPIPSNLTIKGPGAGPVTELDGSRMRSGVKFSDSEFTPEGLRDLKSSPGGGE